MSQMRPFARLAASAAVLGAAALSSVGLTLARASPAPRATSRPAVAARVSPLVARGSHATATLQLSLVRGSSAVVVLGCSPVGRALPAGTRIRVVSAGRVVYSGLLRGLRAVPVVRLAAPGSWEKLRLSLEAPAAQPFPLVRLAWTATAVAA